MCVVISKSAYFKISMSRPSWRHRDPSTHWTLQNHNQWSYKGLIFWKSITRDTTKTISKKFCIISSGYEDRCHDHLPHSFSLPDRLHIHPSHITNCWNDQEPFTIPPSILHDDSFAPFSAANGPLYQKFHVQKCSPMSSGNFTDRQTSNLSKPFFSRDQ